MRFYLNEKIHIASVESRLNIETILICGFSFTRELSRELCRDYAETHDRDNEKSGRRAKNLHHLLHPQIDDSVYQMIFIF